MRPLIVALEALLSTHRCALTSWTPDYRVTLSPRCANTRQSVPLQPSNTAAITNGV